MTGQPTGTAGHRLADAVEHLFPGYFALVMATGIVSIAAHLQEMPRIAWALLAVNLGVYAVLTAMLVFRLLAYFPRVVEDLNNHARGPGFFTVVAATCVLGTQILILTGRTEVAHALWIAGIGLWVVVMYGFFTATVISETKPSLELGINGAWLLGIVATQSVSVLATLLAPGMASGREGALFFALCMYLLGAMLYLSIITLIFYRFTFVALTVEQMTPPYWINMGAVAITTLAGSSLLLQSDHWSLPDDAPAVHRRLHAVLLGLCDVVDSVAGHPRRMEARRPAFSPALRSSVLGHGVSDRHVHGLHRETGPSHGAGVPLGDPAGHRLLRPGGVGGHVRRHDASPVAARIRDARSVLNRDYLARLRLKTPVYAALV